MPTATQNPADCWSVLFAVLMRKQNQETKHHTLCHVQHMGCNIGLLWAAEWRFTKEPKGGEPVHLELRSASDPGKFSPLEVICVCRWSSSQSRFLPGRQTCHITVVQNQWLESRYLEVAPQRCEDVGLGIWILFLECNSLSSKRTGYGLQCDFLSCRMSLFFFIQIQYRLESDLDSGHWKVFEILGLELPALLTVLECKGRGRRTRNWLIKISWLVILSLLTGRGWMITVPVSFVLPW